MSTSTTDELTGRNWLHFCSVRNASKRATQLELHLCVDPQRPFTVTQGITLKLCPRRVFIYFPLVNYKMSDGRDNTIPCTGSYSVHHYFVSLPISDERSVISHKCVTVRHLPRMADVCILLAIFEISLAHVQHVCKNIPDHAFYNQSEVQLLLFTAAYTVS